MPKLYKGFDREAERFMASHFAAELEAHPFITYDIGASGGFVSFLDWKLLPQQRIHGFEPLSREYAKLEAMYRTTPNHHVHNLAVASENGTIPFYERHKAGTSSIYRVFDDMKLIEVESTRLDDFISRQDAPPDFVKIDIEGAELAALMSGASALARDILGVVSEYSFWRMNPEEKSFSQLDAFMVENGFILFDMTTNKSNHSSIGGKKGKVRTGDALYFKDFKWLYENKLGDVSREEVRVKLLKMILISYHYLYMDYALELAEFGRELGVLDSAEFEVCWRELTTITDLSNRFPNFPGRARISQFLELIAYIVNVNLKKGSPAVYSRLGNSPHVARRTAPPTEVTIYRSVFERRIERRNITGPAGWRTSPRSMQ